MPQGGELEGAPALVVPGRRNDAGAGWTWITEGWKLFVRAPLMWIISMVILFVIAVVVGIIPLIGTLAFQLMQAVFAGGLMYACLSLDRGGDFELEHLFAGFSKRFVPLLVVGALFLLGWIAILLVFMAFAGMSILSAFMAGNTDIAATALMAASGAIVLGTLVTLALSVPLMAAYWFAPALVMIHDMPPTRAMKESFFACFRNFVPFLVYGVIMLFFAIVAAIPFGLGMLVWLPVAIGSTYAGYRSIFTEPAQAPVAPVATRPPGMV
jgi:uncharacterized membrane protein